MKFDFLKRKKNLTDEERKNSAKIELVIFLVFIAFVFAYSRILLIKNNHNNIDKEEFINKVDLSSLKSYDFNIKLNLDNDVYDYNGNISNNNGYMNNYKIVNGEFYDSNLNKVDGVFPEIDNKYFKLDMINSYLSDDNYKNDYYEVFTSDIINNTFEDIVIYAFVDYNEDNIIIKLDYSNLVHKINNEINKCDVVYTITNYKK